MATSLTALCSGHSLELRIRWNSWNHFSCNIDEKVITETDVSFDLLKGYVRRWYLDIQVMLRDGKMEGGSLLLYQ